MPRTTKAQIEWIKKKAGFMLVVERVLPCLIPFLLLVGVFILLSIFNIWEHLSRIQHLFLLICFGLGLLASLITLLAYIPPTLTDIYHYIQTPTENTSGHKSIAHQIRHMDDALPPQFASDQGKILWQAEQNRIISQLPKLNLSRFKPDNHRFDPFGLRYALLLVLIPFFTLAWPGTWQHIDKAFDIGAGAPSPKARIDAWIEPPIYTRLQPFAINIEEENQPTLKIPQNSIIWVSYPEDMDLKALLQQNTAGSSHTDREIPFTLEQAESEEKSIERQGNSNQIKTVKAGVKASSQFNLYDDNDLFFSTKIEMIKDHPPTISFAKMPSINHTQSLDLEYFLQDDYGISEARGYMSLKDHRLSHDIFTKSDGTKQARPLFAAPDLQLNLFSSRQESAVSNTEIDLTQHIWAGYRVELYLEAQDFSHQKDRSQTIEITLPSRKFTIPLARALIELRRLLALDANARPNIIKALDALTLAPNYFTEDAGIFLGLKTAYYRLVRAQSDEDLRHVVDYLWQIAMAIENGDTGTSLETLRAAQKALAEALANNASDEEIHRLTEELRKALQNYMQALAQNATQNDPLNNQQQSGNQLEMEDLDQLLNEIERQSQAGARQNAIDLLSNLNHIIENMQVTQGNQGNQSNPSQQMLNQMGQLLQDQLQLMDDLSRQKSNTDASPSDNQQAQQGHQGQRQGRAQRQGQPQGQNSSQSQNQSNGQMSRPVPQLGQGLSDQGLSDQGLGVPSNKPAQRQNQLNQTLQELMGMMSDTQQRNPGWTALQDAQKSMEMAENNLINQDIEQAIQNQNEAIDALRESAQQIIQEALNQQGAGQDNNQQGMNGDQTDGRGQNNRLNDASRNLDVLNQGNSILNDKTTTQRAKESRDAIRNQLERSDNPGYVTRYLQRLIEKF